MLPSLPSPHLHLAVLRLIAQTAPEPGPALIWVETRAILVQLPPLQPLEASLYIVFPVLSHISVPGLLARQAMGCWGPSPSQCAVCPGVSWGDIGGPHGHCGVEWLVSPVAFHP